MINWPIFCTQLIIEKPVPMKLTIFILTLFIFSCSKDDTKDQCRNYSLVTESNESEARDKCDGLANSYPAFKVLSTVSIGCLTAEELIISKKSESSVTKNACNGVPFTVKVSIK